MVCDLLQNSPTTDRLFFSSCLTTVIQNGRISSDTEKDTENLNIRKSTARSFVVQDERPSTDT